MASVVVIGQLSANIFCVSSHGSLKNTERFLRVWLKDVALQWLSVVLRWGRRVCGHMPLCRVWGIKTGGFRVSKGCLENFLKSKNLAFDVLLVADNASGHRRIEFFWLLHATVVICICLFNKWWCDVCSQVKHHFELQQFLDQSGCMPYADYGAWNIETSGACALALAREMFPPTYRYEDVSKLQSGKVNHVWFVCVLYFDSLELFDFLKTDLCLNFV